MKKLVGLLLLAVFVVAFGVGYVISANTASAAPPPPCTTFCSPGHCAAIGGHCVKTGPKCFDCQIL